MLIPKILKNTLKREGGFGLLNLLGLSISMAIALIIVWYLLYHLSFDRNIPKSKSIYRLICKDKSNGTLSFGNPLPFAGVIPAEYPEPGDVAAASSIYEYDVMAKGEKYSIMALAATSNIFEFLELKLIAGSEKDALPQPGGSVITQSCAKKLFGDENPIGQVYTVQTEAGAITCAVNGIIMDPTANTSFSIEACLSWQSLNPPDWRSKWWWSGTNIFVKLDNEAQKDDLERKVNTLLDRYNSDFIKGRYDFHFIPLIGSHFRTDIENTLTPAISSKLLLMLGLIAVFIVVVACINFVNLSIAQSEKNIKDAGIHKVMGATRTKMASNYLVLTFIKIAIAIALSLIVAYLLLPSFRSVAQIGDYDPWASPAIWAIVMALLGGVSGFLAGLYPALIMARSKPVALLSGHRNGDG